MESLRKLLRSGHVHVSLATGVSIIVLAWFSKRVLPEPLSYLELAAPPFLMAIYEAVAGKAKESRAARSGWWVAAILLATAAVIWANRG